MQLWLLAFLAPFALSIPIYGGTRDFGYYFADLMMGTPPQRLSVIIDTGSDGVSVTCASCSSCGTMHMDPFYNPEISSSFAPLDRCPLTRLRTPACTFDKRYLEGSSLKGRFYSDRIEIFDSSFPKQMEFGCIESETRLFLEQKANGILGLAPNPKSHLLFDGNKIEAFSLCLATAGGDMQVHGDLPAPPDAISLLYSNNQYTVEPLEISISSSSEQVLWSASNQTLPGYVGTKALIDSGSTITYLKDSLFQVLKKYIDESLRGIKDLISEDKSGSSLCWTHGSDVKIGPLLPVINFAFKRQSGSGVITTEFKDFISTETLPSDRVKTCLTVASNMHLSRTDLGASWMINKKITFSTTAGWLHVKKSTCTSVPIENRPPVIALPGQIVVHTPMSIWSIIGVAIVFSTMALILLAIVRKSIQPSSYVPVEQ